MEKLGIFAIFLLLHTNGLLCEDNPCRHALANTDVVDLTPLKTHQYITYASNNQIYVFSICEDSKKIPEQILPKDESNPCTKDEGYSLCLFNSTSPVNSTKLAKTSEWKWTENQGNISLTTKFNASELRIQLSCLSSSHESTFFVATPAADPKDVAREFHLLSPLACPQKVAHDDGLSTGSVLMIILLVAFITYLGIGIVVNFFLVGARGMEVIPNIQFWRNLPGLVMDGIRFVQNGCKVRPSDLVQGRDTYDSI
ncbi:cation-dependent mannose-6-phosphate receptor-like [Phlebotomus argentipes]|uniref:cation-dependent mannose-6-phosphate receptor-like n=1 Tax=Phlebotomus argentipes TaxID=94469 RepID=UPI0028934F87|nr:cation-dependent mannose-6-phosphate receptor-like [Phlebotomus argentipes]